MSSELGEGMWCVLELFGHRRLGGFVRETTLAGEPFLRIDIPDGAAVIGDNAAPPTVATQLYNGKAVYCLTPCGIKEALAVARSNRPQPVTRWEMDRPALPHRDGGDEGVGEDDDPGLPWR